MKPTVRLRLFFLSSTLLAAPLIHAANLYWDGGTVNIVTDGNGLSAGGNGDWNATLLNWDFGASPHVAWNNSNNDTAIFGGTAGTVTLTGNISVGGLTFNTTGYNITTTGFSLNFADTDNTILFNNIAAASITGPVGGSGNVILSTSNPALGSAQTLTLNGSSATGWSGTTTINAGMTLALAADNRALSNSTGITFGGGNLTLTNTTATEAGYNRVADGAGITSAGGGTFTWTNTAASARVYAEQIGSVDLVRGQLNFALTNNQNGGGTPTNSQTLTLSGLTRTGTTNSSVVSFGSASGLNITTNIIEVTGKSGSATVGGQGATGTIIGPWATYGTTPGSPTDYAAYDSNGRVLNANIAANNTETSWGSSGNVNIFVNNTGTTTLTGTRTINTLRYQATSTPVLSLGASNYSLETYGVLGSTTAFTISTTGTGGLTTPNGGGYLHITGGAGVTVSAPINDNGGAVTVVKSGSNTLTLSSTTSNFSGGIVLNAGALTTTSDANLGIGGGITVNGAASWNTSVGTSRAITINEGGVLTLTGASNQIYSGLLSGVGTLASNTSNVYNFNNTGNSLTGTVTISYGMNFANIGDSTNAINIGNTNANAGFGWTGGSKTFAQRVFTLNATGNGYITSNGSGAMLIEQDLAITGTAGARTLNLQGNNTAFNTFSGNIANGTDGGTSVVGLTKSGGGVWALGGTNTYTGDTNLAASGTTGVLIFQGSQALSPNTKLIFAQNSSNVQSARFLDDGATPGIINFNRPIEFGGGNTTQALNIFVGNNNTANGGASAGTTTDRTIQIGDITHTSLATDTGTWNLNATGANGYRLQTGTITMNNLVNRTAGNTTVYSLNPTTANMTVAAVTMADGNAGSGVDGIPILRLGGTSLDNYVAGAISNATSGVEAVRFEKTGISTWTLQGTNTYTGTTTVSGGRLLLSSTGSLHANSAVTVSGGALGGTGTVNGTVTVNSTGGIDLRDSAIGTFTLANTLGIGGAAGANNLVFDLGNGTGTSDQISVGGTTTVTTANSAVITLNQLGGLAGRTDAATYKLIVGAGALDATNFGKFTLATTKAFGQTYALVRDTVDDANGNLHVTADNVTSATAAAFWKGGNNNWSTATNWNTDATSNVGTGAAPDYRTNVTFSTTTPTAANLTTNVLDVDFDINSLTFTNASGNVTIGGTKMLTIEATNANSNTAGNGIDSQKTTGTNTISAKVGLAASQTWTVAGGGTLAVSGAISDFGGGYGLTKSGGGDLNLSGVNTFTGATTISQGILRLTGASALAGTSGVSIASGASLFVTAASPTFSANQFLTLNGTGATGTGALVTATSGTTTWNGAVSLGSNSLVLQGSGTTLAIGGDVSLGANTLAVETAGANSTTISGTINGTGGLTKTGASTLILSRANTYTGATTVSAGTLSLAPSSNTLGGVLLASSSVTLNQGATLLLNASVTANAGSSGYSLAAPITLAGGAGTASIRFSGNDQKYVVSGNISGQAGAAQTLTLAQGHSITGGDRQHILVSGAIANGGSGGTLAVTVDFAGASGVGQNAFMSLTGQNTFTGNLTVNNSKLMNAGSVYPGAWLTIGGERWYSNATSPASLETVGTGYLGTAGVYNGNITINTGNGTSGTGITTLSFLTSANQTLNGNISGAGNLRQDGTGILKLTGTNTNTGTTVVSAGTMQFAKQESLYNNTPASWTAANINVKNGATLAVNVDSAGTNGFTAANLNTLLTNISVANTAAQGLQAGARIGFDTSTATGGTFTQGNAIANSTGSGSFHGAIGVTKLGTGTLVLDKTNTYTGTTTLTEGTLAITGTGSINSTSAINVAAGATFVYNSSTALGVGPTLNGAGTGAGQRAILGGTGPINTAVTLNNLGDVLSPGNSPGIQSYTANQSWASFSYDWEINDWLNSVAGTDIDQIQITGLLDFSATAANSYLLNIFSLAGDNSSGNVSNFGESSKSWAILTTSGGITGFNASEWTINALGFTNNETGTWSLGLSGNDLVLTYAPIPEPRTALLGALSALLLLRRRRK